jgi:hypothetical protein
MFSYKIGGLQRGARKSMNHNSTNNDNDNDNDAPLSTLIEDLHPGTENFGIIGQQHSNHLRRKLHHSKNIVNFLIRTRASIRLEKIKKKKK